MSIRYRPRLTLLEDRCLPSAASLDPAFGPNANGQFINTMDGNGAAGMVAGIQGDGKIIVAAQHAAGQAALLRYNTDGSLDSGFGTGGVVYFVGGSYGEVLRSLDMAIRPDGDVVAVGRVANKIDTTRSYDFVNLFDSTGRLLAGGHLLLGTSTDFVAGAVQPDGKIVVAGVTPNFQSASVYLTRFNSDLSGDASFHPAAVSFRALSVSDVALQPGDGKVLVLATVDGALAYTYGLAVVRYNADGSLDTTFGDGSGIARVNLTTGDSLFASRLAVQADGRILLVGTRENSSGLGDDVFLARLTPTGALDNDPATGFGADHSGMVVRDFGNLDRGADVGVQASGKVLVAGYTGQWPQQQSNGTASFLLARYNADGTPDTTFDDAHTGYVTTSFSAYDNDVDARAAGLAQQADGRVVLVGSGAHQVGPDNWVPDLALARYEGVNHAPVVQAIADQAVNEGGTLTVPVHASDPDSDALTYSLDSGPPGASIDPETGVFTWTAGDGPATASAVVRVTDNGAPPLSTTASFNIGINNVAPTAGLSGPVDGFHGVANQRRTFSLSASDPSGADQAAGFSFLVDWGDGTGDTVTGLSGAAAGHTWAAPGTYTVSVTATDKDGGVSGAATGSVTILAVEKQGTTLAVGGTSGDDAVVLTAGTTAGAVQAAVNGTSLGGFAGLAQAQVFGGDGQDTVTINGSSGNDAIAVNGSTVGLRGVTYSASGVESWEVQGQGGNDTFTITGSGLAAVLGGGAGNNTFKVGTGVVFDGSIDGGDGTNTLVAGNDANAWVLNGYSLGTLNGAPFVRMTNLTGGSGADTFTFQPGITSAAWGIINGGGGKDTLDYSAYDKGVQIDLQAGTATGMSGFVSIEAFIGSANADTLRGPGKASTFLITTANGGTVGTVSFASFENLVGSGGNSNVFRLSDGAGVSGSLDGGGGSHSRLDYSLYTTGVAVNLALGTATNVAGGISGFADVTGGSGNDNLTGDGGPNILMGNKGNDTLTGGGGNDILVGGAGNDVLVAGPGRNILIGGQGADQLTGSTGQDLLIGGYTSFDTNVAALEALLLEWQRTDVDYATRIAHLRGTQSGGLNGSYYLTPSTVHDDKTTDALTGGDDLDWFWGQLGEIWDLEAGEQVN